MAEMNEMMSRGNGLSAYETFKMAEVASRKANGGTVTAIVLGGVATALGVGAWIFGPVFSNSKSNGVRDLVVANQRNTDATIDRLANLLATERNERVAQGTTISQTITDSISGQQSSTLSAQQAAELSSIQSLQQTLLNDAVTGRSSLNPTPVSIYAAPRACGCPGCGD